MVPVVLVVVLVVIAKKGTEPTAMSTSPLKPHGRIQPCSGHLPEPFVAESVSHRKRPQSRNYDARIEILVPFLLVNFFVFLVVTRDREDL